MIQGGALYSGGRAVRRLPEAYDRMWIDDCKAKSWPAHIQFDGGRRTTCLFGTFNMHFSEGGGSRLWRTETGLFPTSVGVNGDVEQ